MIQKFYFMTKFCLYIFLGTQEIQFNIQGGKDKCAPVDFGYKMHFRIKILALHGQHNLQTLIQSQKNVGQIPNFLLKSSKRLRRSELHCAHSSINVGLLCHCSLYGYEFFDNFCLFVILIYDIYNKISKLDLFGHFCFWPLLASYRGH